MMLNYPFSNFLGQNLGLLKKGESINSYLEDQESEEIGDRFYITNKKRGVGFVFDVLKTLIAIHFHSGINGYTAYTGLLPCEIDFEDNIDGAHRKIGLENFESGGGEILPILGPSNLWRRYNYSNYYLTIEFNQKGALILITLGLMR